MKAEVPAWRQFYRAVTGPWRTAAAVCRIIFCEYGFWRSVQKAEPIDREGREIPWFTYPAIEFLRQFDFSGKSVFEFGAGNSTLFWCRHAARIVSVESDRAWFGRIRPKAAANAEIHLVEVPEHYPQVLADCQQQFDVIVVDGIERRACCAEAVKKLRAGGFIILDNADWHHQCAALLRDAGLLEVDMTGLGPINGYTWTTSFFFHREFAFPLQSGRQPMHGLGSLPQLEPE